MEKRPVARFLAPAVTEYIREMQDKGASGKSPHRLLPELEELEGEWSQNDRQPSNHRGRKRCLMGVSFIPHAADLSASERTEVKKLRQRDWEQTSVSRWKDSPDPLPDTDVLVSPGRVDQFKTVIPARGFVRVISESVQTVEQYGGVSIEIGEGLATCADLDLAWTITSMTWEYLKAGWRGAPEELIRRIKLDCERQMVLESKGYRSATWRTLRALQRIHGAEEIWGCTCVTAPPFFSRIGSPVGKNADAKADRPVVIVWDGLNVEEREGAMNWMATSKSWVLWRQHDSLSSTGSNEDEEERKLQSLLEDGGWSLRVEEKKTEKGPSKHQRKTNSGANKTSSKKSRGETQSEGWTGGSVRHKNWWRSGQVKLA